MSLSATSVSHPFVQPGFSSDDQDGQQLCMQVELNTIGRGKKDDHEDQGRSKLMTMVTSKTSRAGNPRSAVIGEVESLEVVTFTTLQFSF